MAAWEMALKIAVGVFALIVAVLAVTEIKGVRPKDFENPKAWWRRLTPAGVIKLVCAIITLALLATNEWITYSDGVNSKVTADATQRGLEEKIKDAHDGMLFSIGQLKVLARQNDYLVASLDGSLNMAGIARVPAEKIDRRYYELAFDGGEPLTLKRGDVIDWSIVCAGGPLPAITTPDHSSGCAQAGYGRLMADGFQIPLMQQSGHNVFFGSKSTGGILSYRSPAETDNCPAMAETMKAQHCEVQLSVMRQARWKYEEAISKGGLSTNVNGEKSVQDACREYEAIFNDSCSRIVEQPSR
jgi:hypothetical protein